MVGVASGVAATRPARTGPGSPWRPSAFPFAEEAAREERPRERRGVQAGSLCPSGGIRPLSDTANKLMDLDEKDPLLKVRFSKTTRWVLFFQGLLTQKPQRPGHPVLHWL